MTLVTAQQLADQLGVNLETIYRWTNQRKIATYRLPGGHVRYPVDEIMETLRQDPIKESAA